MEKEIEEFIRSCLELGKEQIDKENPTEAEKQFLSNLNVIVDKYLS